MWKWSLLALGLGLLFAVLAWSGLRRRSSWRDGEKLWGQVMGVSVTPAWNGADSMDGDRSPARVTLRLSLEGREVSLQKDFPKVLAAPALGQRVQVLYRRSTGEWALWKDVRSWWVLWAILAATACGGVSPAAVGRKNRGRPALRLHRRPPQPGRQRAGPARGLWGRGNGGGPCLGACSCLCCGTPSAPLPGLPAPYWASGSRAKPNLWAGCRSPTGTAGSVPTPCSPWGKARTFSPAVTRQKHFAPGDILTVYKSPKGRFSLEPEPLDYLLIPIALVPVFFVGLFVLWPFGDGGL